MLQYKISEIPRYATISQLKKSFVKNLKIKVSDFKITYVQKNDFGFIIFKESLSSQQLEQFENFYLKNNVKLKFRRLEDKEDGFFGKKSKEICFQSHNTVSMEIDIRDVVTTLWKMPYEEQLTYKSNTLESFYKNIYKNFISMKSSDTKVRNNCQFSFGFDKNNDIIVGFRGHKFIEYPNLVYNVSNCLNVSENMKNIVGNLNNILQDKKDLVFDRINKKGFLMILSVREFNDKSLSLIKIKSKDISLKEFSEIIDISRNILTDNSFLQISNDTFEGIKPEKNILSKELSDSFLNEIKTKYTQPDETLDISPVVICLKGHPDLETCLLSNFKFKISIFSFFQINTEVTEYLIQKIKKLKTTDTLLDLCCGTGMFSVCLNKDFNEIIGLELSKECISDAHRNIKINGINNITLVENTVEKAKFPDKECSVILDPPRNGVSNKLMNKIKNHIFIKEIFYISCAYEKTLNNILEVVSLIDLPSFKVEWIGGFDMFPNTKNTEVLIYLKRN
ncbi:tRNA (uracil-5-)-methyltransferase [Hamiltosporidium tvaerminnensis]|uniref:tRNA (Uracil-5-)-methyltransferase n=1 Tax=Hamiltosporidium tvaerminnensis TaxID=1176355 RepID=A0A4V2JXW8_9MICR|nr:tRNA methyltransferase 2 [Hamiltosporidium tvaerminnensis]TBU13462.1 tRNA (uracil-5-)-methyltransferase [Hamiltosporidium tvaerminnensis]